MPLRLLAATPLGLTVTLALVLVMQTLIDTGLNPLTSRISPKLPVWIAQPPADLPPVAEPPALLRPSPAPITPSVHYAHTDDAVKVTGVTLSAEPPTGSKQLVLDISPLADGALVQIRTAQPVYPISALERSLEGYVTVRFDVDARGRTENVQVVEASHAVFERAAVRAASKLRFKPTVVDGSPQPTRGMAYRFRFELDD